MRDPGAFFSQARCFAGLHPEIISDQRQYCETCILGLARTARYLNLFSRNDRERRGPSLGGPPQLQPGRIRRL
jgi:hypothetical protein